jgi:hypothetical protein
MNMRCRRRGTVRTVIVAGVGQTAFGQFQDRNVRSLTQEARSRHIRAGVAVFSRFHGHSRRVRNCIASALGIHGRTGSLRWHADVRHQHGVCLPGATALLAGLTSRLGTRSKRRRELICATTSANRFISVVDTVVERRPDTWANRYFLPIPSVPPSGAWTISSFFTRSSNASLAVMSRRTSWSNCSVSDRNLVVTQRPLRL